MKKREYSIKATENHHWIVTQKHLMEGSDGTGYDTIWAFETFQDATGFIYSNLRGEVTPAEVSIVKDVATFD